MAILYPSVREYTALHEGLQIINKFQLEFHRFPVTMFSILSGFCGESTSLLLEKHFTLDLKGGLTK